MELTHTKAPPHICESYRLFCNRLTMSGLFLSSGRCRCHLSTYVQTSCCPAAGKYRHKMSQLYYTWSCPDLIWLLRSPALNQNPSQWSQQGPGVGSLGQLLHPKLYWCHWPALALDIMGRAGTFAQVWVFMFKWISILFIINGREMRLPTAISACLERLCWLLRFNLPLLYKFHEISLHWAMVSYMSYTCRAL